MDGIQQRQPKAAEMKEATTCLKSSSPSDSKGSFDSLIDYYTNTARLHQDRDKNASMKTLKRPSSFTTTQKQSMSCTMEETKEFIMDESTDSMDERDRYLSRGFSEISASSILLSLSSADVQDFVSSDRKTNEAPKAVVDVSSTYAGPDTSEVHRSVSFKNVLCSTFPPTHRYSNDAEETKEDGIHIGSESMEERVFGRALSELSLEAGSVVLSMSSSDLRPVSTLDPKNSEVMKPISDIMLFLARSGNEEEDSGIDSSNDPLDRLMATSLRSKHKREHGIFERENSRMSVESILNRGWSLKSWDGSVCSSDIRHELERGLSHMTM